MDQGHSLSNYHSKIWDLQALTDFLTLLPFPNPQLPQVNNQEVIENNITLKSVILDDLSGEVCLRVTIQRIVLLQR